MAALSKGPWRAFENNINKAYGMVKLQFYADDLIRTGGKESIGKLMEFLSDMYDSFGVSDVFDFEDIVEDIGPILERDLGPKIEEKLKLITERFDAMTAEQIEGIAKSFKDKHEGKFDYLGKLVNQLALAVENALLEQALVMAVTALEVYIHDVTEEAVLRNVFIRKRFTNQLRSSFDYDSVMEAGGSVEQASARIVTKSYDFNDSRKLKKHVDQLIGSKVVLQNSSDMERFKKILHYRHLIVHRAGIVDRTFAKRTGYKGRIGGPVHLTNAFVDESLCFISGLAREIQQKCANQKARHV